MQYALYFLNLSMNKMKTQRSEYMTMIFLHLLNNGWLITRASCLCGGTLAWLKPLNTGAYEMHGCICHSTPHSIQHIKNKSYENNK